MINLSATNFSAIVILYKFDRTTPIRIDTKYIFALEFFKIYSKLQLKVAI